MKNNLNTKNHKVSTTEAMMTSALLRSAALSAGYRVKRDSSNGLIVWIDDEPTEWNPLSNKEDAYDLAGTLGDFKICHNREKQCVVVETDKYFAVEYLKHHSNPEAATMFAITRLAAQTWN